jgi:DHA2 family multidrug resistance protein-like MFS transporter
LGGIGLTLFACGLGALALMPVNPGPFDVIWRMALSGVGFGLFQTPNNRTMIAAAPRERSGGASGMLGTARLLGQTTGRCAGGAIPGALPIQWHADLAADGRRLCPARSSTEHAEIVARGRTRRRTGAGS